jgi:hypothetical protein
MLKDGSCVTYDIINRLCVIVNMIYSEDGHAEALSFSGGCYAGDSVAQYVQASPDKMYKFDYIPVEVREK